MFFLILGLQTALFSYQSLRTKSKRQSQWEKLFQTLMQHLSICSFSSNDQISLRHHVCTEIDQRSWQIFNHLIASGAKLLVSHDFKGGYLHEEVTNSQSSKELSCQFVPVLSNGEGLNSIWASLNFWSHSEIYIRSYIRDIYI